MRHVSVPLCAMTLSASVILGLQANVTPAIAADSVLRPALPTPEAGQVERALRLGETFQDGARVKDSAATTPQQAIPEVYAAPTPLAGSDGDDDLFTPYYDYWSSRRLAAFTFPHSAWCWPPIACQPIAHFGLGHHRKFDNFGHELSHHKDSLWGKSSGHFNPERHRWD